MSQIRMATASNFVPRRAWPDRFSSAIQSWEAVVELALDADVAVVIGGAQGIGLAIADIPL